MLTKAFFYIEKKSSCFWFEWKNSLSGNSAKNSVVEWNDVVLWMNIIFARSYGIFCTYKTPRSFENEVGWTVLHWGEVLDSPIKIHKYIEIHLGTKFVDFTDPILLIKFICYKAKQWFPQILISLPDFLSHDFKFYTKQIVDQNKSRNVTLTQIQSLSNSHLLFEYITWTNFKSPSIFFKKLLL